MKHFALSLIGMLTLGFVASDAHSAAGDSLPTDIEVPAAIFCGGEVFQDYTGKPFVPGPINPDVSTTVCNQSMSLAITLAYAAAAVAYGELPWDAPNVDCVFTQCPDELTCAGYQWHDVELGSLTVVFDAKTGEWCATVKATDYLGGGAGCTDCGVHNF